MINHTKFRTEVLEKFTSELDLKSYLPAELLAKNLKFTSHLEAIHESLHVLTGGSIIRPMLGTITPNSEVSAKYKLLMFDAFKAIAGGVLKGEDFENLPRERSSFQEVLDLINGEPNQVKRIFKCEKLNLSPEELQSLCDFAAATSKAYIDATSRWINNVVRCDGDHPEIAGYMLRVREAEESQKAGQPLTPANKIYLNSNIARVYLEDRGTARGLEGLTESPRTSAAPRAEAAALQGSSSQAATK